MQSIRLGFLALLLVLISVLALPSPGVQAATYVVDTAADDPGIALQACTGAAGDCSLRGAITKANIAATPGDIINFDATVFPPGAPVAIPIASPLTR